MCKLWIHSFCSLSFKPPLLYQTNTCIKICLQQLVHMYIQLCVCVLGRTFESKGLLSRFLPLILPAVILL